VKNVSSRGPRAARATDPRTLVRMPRPHADEAPRTWHGAVLAGGASRRFGRDKVFADIDGIRMVDLAVAALAGARSVTLVVGSPERMAATRSAAPPGVPVLADDAPGHGPAGGLATALARHPQEWVAVLAADLPLVPEGWWARLAERYRPGALALVPRHEGGRWEPLAALYHGALAPELVAAVAREEHALQPWLERLAGAGLVVPVSVAALPAGALLNVNTPDDARALVAWVRRSRSGRESGA
jgi:molybdenum cofactor guanylyltransferase